MASAACSRRPIYASREIESGGSQHLTDMHMRVQGSLREGDMLSNAQRFGLELQVELSLR